MIVTNFPVSSSRAYDSSTDTQYNSLLFFIQMHTNSVGNLRRHTELDGSTRVYDVTINQHTYWMYKPQYDFIREVAEGKDITHAHISSPSSDPYTFTIFYIEPRL